MIWECSSCWAYSALGCRKARLVQRRRLALRPACGCACVQGPCQATGAAQLTQLPITLLQDNTSTDAPTQLVSTEELKAYTMAGPSLKMSHSFFDDLFDAHLPIYAWVVDTGPQLQASR